VRNILHSLLITSLLQQVSVARLAREQAINIFQLKTLGLREEQEDDWYPEGIEHGEDDVCAPSDVIDSGRCDLHDNLSNVSMQVSLGPFRSNSRSYISSSQPSKWPTHVVAGAEAESRTYFTSARSTFNLIDSTYGYTQTVAWKPMVKAP
jgi:hypothetical protein